MEHDEDYDDYEEGPCCRVCDALLAPNAIYCACGAAQVELADPCEGMTFEQRMAFEYALEQEERGF